MIKYYTYLDKMNGGFWQRADEKTLECIVLNNPTIRKKITKILSYLFSETYKNQIYECNKTLTNVN